MQDSVNTVTKTARRAVILVFAAAFAFLALLCRILILQTAEYEKYSAKVMDQLTTQSSVKASRGLIYDRNGDVLAGNVTTYRVFISPSAIQKGQDELTPDAGDVSIANTIAANLSTLLGVSYDRVMKQTEYTRYLDRTIATQVNEGTAEQILRFVREYGYENYVFLQATTSRYYPYDTLACHVLGFTGTDGGSIGLELTYDEYLSGTDGKYLVARDAQGNPMPSDYEEYVEAADGNNLVTTIDRYVQSILEDELKTVYTETGASRTTGIVMDVTNGEILAMANYPDFSLNSFAALNDEMQAKLENSGLSEASDEYETLKTTLMMEMWRNEAVSDSYTPGSTFKIVTASMALEENLVQVSDTVYCGGSLTIAGKTIHCHKLLGHGKLTFAEGIQQSCNVWLMSLSQKFGLTASTFYQYFKAFGYSEKTGIDLPGEGGSTFWPLEDFLKSPLNLPIASFGQNFTVTAIQQITAVAAVANGGYLVVPHLMKEITDAEGNTVKTYVTTVKRQILNQDICDTLTQILEEGVSGNGGAKNAYVAGYRVAAKTGTAEKEPKNENKYVCSCIAYAPADDPKYAILIIADEPTNAGYQYGSTAAAPFVSDIFSQILPYLGVEAKYTQAEQEQKKVTVPGFSNWTVSLATQYAENLGLRYEIVGNGEYVTSQSPAKGSVVDQKNAKVIFYTEKIEQTATCRVPNVVGMTAIAANQALANAGLNLRITGNQGTTVLSQSVAGGTTVVPGTVVTLVFGEITQDYEAFDVE